MNNARNAVPQTPDGLHAAVTGPSGLLALKPVARKAKKTVSQADEDAGGAAIGQAADDVQDAWAAQGESAPGGAALLADASAKTAGSVAAAASGTAGAGAGTHAAAVPPVPEEDDDDGAVFALVDGGTSLLAPVLGGGLALALGGGGGGGGGVATVANLVTGTITAGPLVAGHGLKVEVYAANGTTKLGEGTADASGRYSVNVGSYTGIVIARVVDADGGTDYLDEATGANKDLNAVLTAATVHAGGTLTLNINPVTTIAAQKAGLAADGSGSLSSTTAVANANAAVADAFGLSDIIATTIVPVNGGSYNPTDGLSVGEQYGAILAALSGADANHSGNSQTVIDTLVGQITANGSTGSLGGAGQTLLANGATTADGQVSGNLASDAAATMSSRGSGAGGDTTPPGALSLALASDSGSSASDKITSNGQVNVSGQETGATWMYSTDNGANWSTGSGSSFTLTGDGAKSVQVRQTDAAGNLSAAASDTFTLDTAPPTVSGVAITAATGSQNSTLNAGDVISVTVTMSEATTVSGTPQLALDIGGTTVQAGYASGSGTTALVFTYTILAGQSDANGIRIAADSLSLNGGTLKDAAGNNATLTHSTVTDNASYKVDTTAPTANFSAATDDVGASTGTLSSGARTDDTALVLSGSCESGSTVNVYDGTTLLGAATVTGTSWSYTATVANGTTYQFNVKETDAAGNISAATSNFTVIGDTGAPTVSSVAITSATGSQNSTLNAGDVVSVTVTLSEAVLVSGTPQLALDIGGATVQAAYASGSGTSQLVFGYTIQAGQNDAGGISIAANALALNGGTIRDAAGNAATLSHAAVADNAGYKVDTAVAVPTLDLAAASDSGSSSSDNVTNDTTPTFDVTGEDGATITLFKDLDNDGVVDAGESLGTTTLSGTTSGSITASALAAGAYGNIKVIQTDAAGNTSAASAAHATLTVDTAAAAPTLDLAASSDTGNSTDNITSDTTPTFNVTGESGAAITLFNDLDNDGVVDAGESLGTTTLSGTTNGTITASTLAAATYSYIKVIQTDAAGNTSAASTAHAAITISNTTVPTLALDAASDTGSSNTDNITSDTTPTFNVTGTSGATITLFNDLDNDGVVDAGESLGTTTLSGTTSGSITASALAAGTYDRVKVYDSASTTASAAHAPLVIETVAPAVTNSVTDDFNDTAWDNWVRPTAYGNESMTGTTLQLTSATNSQAGGALYNKAFVSSQDMTFEFRYYSGDGTGADGISFFLVDGANTAFNLGDFGSNLGYAVGAGNNGLDGGWLGVGLYEYNGGNGIFTNNAGSGTAGIGVVGSESATTPYQHIASTREYISAGSTLDMDNHSIDGGYRRVKVTLGSSATNTLQVQWDWNDDGTYDYTPINIDLDSYASLVAARPDSLKFGFAAGTGGLNNQHAIDWVTVTTGSTAVAITSATGAQNSTLNAGDVVRVTVTLSEPAVVTGTPQLALNIGGTLVQAAYASGSGSNALVFTYTILAGQNDANGISIDANSLSLNGGTIKALSGGDATILHAAVADNASYLVDTTAPTTTLSGIDISADTGTSASDFVTSTAGQTITATLSAGLATGEVLYGSVDNGASWSNITAKVSGTALSWDGATLAGSSTIQLKVSDAAGNDGTVASQNYVLDTAAPTASVTAAAIANNGNAVVQSTETGTAYLVKSTLAVGSLADITSAADGQWNSVAIATANSDTALSVAGLEAGAYKVYTIDAAGNLSTVAGGTVLVSNTTDANKIDLGSGNGSLIAPVYVDGNWYFYWDRSGDGTSADTGSLNGGVDYVNHDVLDGIFRYASDFTTLDSDSNTDNTYRYAMLNGVKLALPTLGVADTAAGYRNGTAVDNSPAGEANSTYDDLLAIWDAYNGTGTAASTAGTPIPGSPTGWQAQDYWAATSWTGTLGSSGHVTVNLNDGNVLRETDTSLLPPAGLSYVALQVL